MHPDERRQLNSTTDTLKLAITRELHENSARSTLSFCYSACRIDGHCIGWLPKAAYDEAHLQGRIVALWNNDDLVAFCLHSITNAELRCLQIWVRRDARLILHGRALVSWLDWRARRAGAYRLRLWCAIDLPANLFWRALHFHPQCWRWGPAKRSRRHILWTRRVIPHALSLDSTVPPQPVELARTTLRPTLLLPAQAT